MSIDRAAGWKSHANRMKRWKSRATGALSDFEGTPVHDASDFVLAYFVWCHSMREWLINDKAITKNKLDDKLSNYPVWLICRDIANRQRHFEITRNPHDQHWIITQEYDYLSEWQGRSKSHKLNYFSRGSKTDVATLMREADRMWDDILATL